VLPHIEPIVNIRHRIPGKTCPILLSNEKQTFILTLVEDERRLFMYDAAGLRLSEFKGVGNAVELLRSMDHWHDFWALESGMEKLAACLKRILARDDIVIKILAEKFPDYTPKATNQWEEGPSWNEEPTLDELIEYLEELAQAVR
jgi:hypothetical protein